jgi:hypothetical protein
VQVGSETTRDQHTRTLMAKRWTMSETMRERLVATLVVEILKQLGDRILDAH